MVPAFSSAFGERSQTQTADFKIFQAGLLLLLWHHTGRWSLPKTTDDLLASTLCCFWSFCDFSAQQVVLQVLRLKEHSAVKTTFGLSLAGKRFKLQLWDQKYVNWRSCGCLALRKTSLCQNQLLSKCETIWSHFNFTIVQKVYLKKGLYRPLLPFAAINLQYISMIYWYAVSVYSDVGLLLVVTLIDIFAELKSIRSLLIRH